MPEGRQILGVNSVTNIELNTGLMPAPIVRNEHWLENFIVAASPLLPVNRRRCSGSLTAKCAQ
ncbi:MAG: hypothetical protein PW845_00310 [Pseudomonas sp.]|nr:hypothetical protein [Pseudomonas sp. PIA16]MDE1163843.1 hypothetical protein [Pseudomonas sp.]